MGKWERRKIEEEGSQRRGQERGGRRKNGGSGEGEEKDRLEWVGKRRRRKSGPYSILHSVDLGGGPRFSGPCLIQKGTLVTNASPQAPVRMEIQGY